MDEQESTDDFYAISRIRFKNCQGWSVSVNRHKVPCRKVFTVYRCGCLDKAHVPAYLDGGLADLPLTDLALIGGQPNIEEWIDKDTWNQAIDSGLVVGEEKVKGAIRSIENFVDATLDKLTSWKN